MFQHVDKAKVFFYFSLFLMVFGYGVAVGAYRIFPHDQLQFMKNSFDLVLEEAPVLTGVAPAGHLQPSRYAGTGVAVHDPSRTSPGLTLVASFFDDDVGVRLLDEAGDVLNQWPMRVHDVWDDLEHVLPPDRRPETDWNVLLNGVMLLPDGSLVVSLWGLVKVDRCGDVLWKTPAMTHHSLEPSSSGGFWVPGQRYHDEDTPHPLLDVPFFEETILEVSADGEVLREIDVPDLLVENGLRPLLFSNNRHFELNVERDLVHLNDVEELTAEFADAFPTFDAGDLLVSIREPNMVFVLDPVTERIEWYRVGPWIQQHDADFQPDGTITVFDNNYDGTEDGALFGGSRIIRVDPETGTTEVLYGGTDDQPMYTSTQGDHQVLSNGNILIAEATAGRVLEVDPEGNVVWEYVNRWAEEEVVRVADAIRYPREYFEPDAWTCEKTVTAG